MQRDGNGLASPLVLLNRTLQKLPQIHFLLALITPALSAAQDHCSRKITRHRIAELVADPQAMRPNVRQVE